MPLRTALASQGATRAPSTPYFSIPSVHQLSFLSIGARSLWKKQYNLGTRVKVKGNLIRDSSRSNTNLKAVMSLLLKWNKINSFDNLKSDINKLKGDTHTPTLPILYDWSGSGTLQTKLDIHCRKTVPQRLNCSASSTHGYQSGKKQSPHSHYYISIGLVSTLMKSSSETRQGRHLEMDTVAVQV